MIAAQESSSWRNFRNTSKFRLTIIIESGTVELLPHSGFSVTSLELYALVYLGKHKDVATPQTKEERELTKQKTVAVKGTLNPVWEHNMPFCDLQYNDTLVFFEVKSRKMLGENPVLGSFHVPLKELMDSTVGSSVSHFNYKCEKADVARCEITVGVQLSPSLPPQLDETVQPSSLRPSNISMTSTATVLPRDLAYSTVNQNYSSLLFDCGLTASREGLGSWRQHGRCGGAAQEKEGGHRSSGVYIDGGGGQAEGAFVSDLEQTLKI